MPKICGVSRLFILDLFTLRLYLWGPAVKNAVKKLLSATILLAYSSYSLADSDFGLYVGAGAGFVSTESTDAFGGDVNFKVGEVLAGLHWRWLGAEYRRGQAVEDEVIDVGLDENTGEFITARTALPEYDVYFLRLQLANEISRIYLLLGQSQISTTSTFSNDLVTDVTDGSRAYGMGAGIRVNDRLFFNLEYKSLYESDEFDLPMFSASIDFHIF